MPHEPSSRQLKIRGALGKTLSVQLFDALPDRGRFRAFVLAPRCYRCAFKLGYDLVILGRMKTAISLPDKTFQRVDDAAKRLGVSRSEFFAQAAVRWLDALEDDGTTEAIDRAIAGLTVDHAFTDAAAAAVAAGDRI